MPTTPDQSYLGLATMRGLTAFGLATIFGVIPRYCVATMHGCLTQEN